MYTKYKKSGIIHKIVRSQLNDKLHTFKTSLDITEFIEKSILNYAEIAFPVGININNIAAHFTPDITHNPILNKDDLIKIDYGVHIDGHITDGAFSWCPSGKYNELINISIGATNVGIKHSGVDVYLGELGGYIQEYIESKEIEIDGKLYQVKSIYDLCGHKIQPYKIHADKAVPNIKLPYFKRMEENEVYAIETFPTIGNTKINLLEECNHYMIPEYSNQFDEVTQKIYKKRATLAFCPRMFDFPIPENIYIKKYPVMIAEKVVAQAEKTIYIKSNKVEILN